jgi:hypothetical protein
MDENPCTTLFDVFAFQLNAPAPSPLPPFEQEIVNSSLQVETLFSHPYPWERWYASHIDYHRSLKPVMPHLGAIREACIEVGLSHIPQMFHDCTFGPGATYRPPGVPAVVTFDFMLTPLAASVILWHELRHAAQHEEAGLILPEPMPDWQDDPAAYWYHPDEVDARSYEKNGLDFPLVVEADSYYVPNTIQIGF